MPDYTSALAKALDARRRVFHGNSATLCLLDYARPGFKGYDILIDVPSGWHLHSGKEPGDPMVLEVAEMGAITRELIDKAVGFGIYIPGISVPEKAWVIIGDEGRKAPTYPTKRIWFFTVSATQEAVNR